MDGRTRSAHRPISRISISLPEALLGELDRMVSERGFDSRSQTIGEMVQQFLLEHKRERGEDVMVGTVTVVYDNCVSGLQQHLSDLQRRHIDEVIGSLHVQLMHNQTMEVILVQGPVKILEQLMDATRCRRGVVCCKMHLIAALIPQLHPFVGAAAAHRRSGTATAARLLPDPNVVPAADRSRSARTD